MKWILILWINTSTGTHGFPTPMHDGPDMVFDSEGACVATGEDILSRRRPDIAFYICSRGSVAK